MKKLCIIAGLLVLLVTEALAADFVLVVNRDNPLDSIGSREIRNIYLGKKSTWPDGAKITLYIQQGDQVTSAFSREVLKKTPQQFFIYWRKALFTGQGTPPVELHDDLAVKKFVAAESGAIGYISPAAVDGTVKVLTIR